MPFQTKQWKDRIVTQPKQRVLTDTTTAAQQTARVSRAEGKITKIGNRYTATELNNLEMRIKKAIEVLEFTLTGVEFDGVSTLQSSTATVIQEADEQEQELLALKAQLLNMRSTLAVIESNYNAAKLAVDAIVVADGGGE